MRHRHAGRTLGRRTEHRIAMWRNMAVSLFTHGQITTTVPKAKSFQPFAEKLISAAKKGDLASRRRVIAKLGGEKWMIQSEDAEGVERNKYGELKKAPKIVKHLFEEIAPRYKNRDGGCTRIVKLAVHRLGDGSDLCVVQLVGDEEGPQVKGRFSRRRAQADNRTAYAASLRNGGSSVEAGTAATTEEPPAAAADIADADAVETSEAALGEAPLAEDVADEPGATQTSAPPVPEGVPGEEGTADTSGASGDVTDAPESGTKPQ